jgi:hypothetical protein
MIGLTRLPPSLSSFCAAAGTAVPRVTRHRTAVMVEVAKDVVERIEEKRKKEREPGFGGPNRMSLEDVRKLLKAHFNSSVGVPHPPEGAQRSWGDVPGS